MISPFSSDRRRRHHTVYILLTITVALVPIALWAADMPSQDIEEELEYLQAETYVITASRVMEEINKAPSSISVVTAKQIREMGARDLKDVFETVTGFDYYYGIFGTYDAEARKHPHFIQNKYLFMINGLPQNDAYLGGGSFGNMSLDNVKRIEFIRGPGSALYGTNAFSGVINIITKEAEDVEGVELTARGGSYNTQQYNVLFGKEWHGLEAVINFNYYDTDGYEGVVESDAQDYFDDIYGTDVAETPGKMNTYIEQYEASMNLKYKGFTLDGKYGDKSAGMPLNSFFLDDQTYSDGIKYYLNLSYENTFWKGMNLLAKIYRTHDESSDHYMEIPEGGYRPWFGDDPAPQDLINITKVKNNRTGIEAQIDFETGHTNTIVSGVTYEEADQYDVKNYSNYLLDGTTFPSIIDVSDIQNHCQDAERNFKAFFMEDIWDIRDNLRLTIGGRYDDYSDFGGHFSPRAGITWEYLQGYDLKLLYGNAFRAPSFSELYGWYYGNPDLGPEIIDTYEVSLGARFASPFSGRATYYQSYVKDGISVNMVEGGVAQYTNHDEVKYEGFEIELKYDFRRGNYLALNYTYQESENLETNETGSIFPKHKGNVIANIRLNKYLNFNTYCHFRDGYKRGKSDPRDDMSGHAIFNATLIAKKFLKRFKGLELRASVYNLFDEDYTLPSASFRLPGDIPRPGRNYMFGIRYAF